MRLVFHCLITYFASNNVWDDRLFLWSNFPNRFVGSCVRILFVAADNWIELSDIVVLRQRFGTFFVATKRMQLHTRGAKSCELQTLQTNLQSEHLPGLRWHQYRWALPENGTFFRSDSSSSGTQKACACATFVLFRCEMLANLSLRFSCRRFVNPDAPMDSRERQERHKCWVRRSYFLTQ